MKKKVFSRKDEAQKDIHATSIIELTISCIVDIIIAIVYIMSTSYSVYSSHDQFDYGS